MLVIRGRGKSRYLIGTFMPSLKDALNYNSLEANIHLIALAYKFHGIGDLQNPPLLQNCEENLGYPTNLL